MRTKSIDNGATCAPELLDSQFLCCFLIIYILLVTWVTLSIFVPVYTFYAKLAQKWKKLRSKTPTRSYPNPASGMTSTAMSTSLVNDAEKGIAQISFLHIPSNVLLSSKTTLPAFSKARQPTKKFNSHASRYTRFQLWFNTYRKFYTFVVLLNAIGLILTIAGIWEYPREYPGALVLGNLLTAVLMRNELFLRFLYLIVNTLFAKWTPLWFRLGCTSALQHIGGIHSGCASMGFVWLIYNVTRNFVNHVNLPSVILIMGIITNLAIFISVLSAFPWVRNTHHNTFERHHRFVGWLGLGFTWSFIILGDMYNSHTHSWDTSGGHLLRQQDFWFILGMTVFVMIPWATVRKVPVQVEIPSAKVAILKFQRGMQQGLLARIGRGTLMEYHAFGIISEGVKADAHYLICGVQGDFTQSLVDNPPTQVWTRQLKFAGVSNTSTLYNRGIRICTGTGLGAALSTCIQNPNWYLIWIGSNQEKTMGLTITNLINKHLTGRVTLWDSKERGGRPDTMELIKSTYASWRAEVVFITSNWQGNKEIMEGCKEAGIPAFGTLWDF